MYIHDCVVVPNFGGFLLHAEYASIDAISEVIHPSNRKVSFNQKLNLNDGLLATFIAEELKISYADAIKLIDIELQVFLQKLNDEKRIEIASLGTFILNDSNNFQFIPNTRTNFLMSAFGLQPLQLHSIRVSLPLEKIEIPAERKINEVNGAQMPPRQSKKKRSGIWYTILATFMIVVLLFNAYILLETYPVEPLSNALSKMNLSSKFEELFSSKSHEVKYAKTKSPKKEVKVESIKVTPPIIVDSVVSSSKPQAMVESPVQSLINNNASSSLNEGDSVYYIVVGAFRHNKKAMALSEQLRTNGYNSSEVVKPKKYHFKLVTVGSFSNMNEVTGSLARVQEVMPDAWVCMSVK